jgi:two-component system nitrate/nitrite response regulator NarL
MRPAEAAGVPRIVLVEDHHLFAETLLVVLEMEGYDASRVRVPEHDVEALLAEVTALAPDLVVLDLDLGPELDGMRLVPGLRAAGVAVLVVTATTEHPRYGEGLHLGAAAVIPKSTSLPEVLETVRAVLDGRPVVTERDRAEMVGEYRRAVAERDRLHRRFDRLTPREAQVLGGLVAGHHVRQIAADATVSEATVRTQVKAVLSKLGVGSQLAAVSMAHSVGWAPPGEAGG